MKILKINEEVETLIEQLNQDPCNEDLVKNLNELLEKKSDSFDSYARAIKILKNNIDLRKKEKADLDTRNKADAALIEKLKGALSYVLLKNHEGSLKTLNHTFSYVKKESIDYDPSSAPDSYFISKTITELDKDRLKEDLEKSGKNSIPGAFYKDSSYLMIR